jgi:hypothetical protein
MTTENVLTGDPIQEMNDKLEADEQGLRTLRGIELNREKRRLVGNAGNTVTQSSNFPAGVAGIKSRGMTVESEGVIMESIIKGQVNNQVAMPAAYFNRGEQEAAG